MSNAKQIENMKTQIKANPSVKNYIIEVFGQNSKSKFIISLYEAVYTMAYNDGNSLEEGHVIAMEALSRFPELLKNTLS
jgi:hypothetical protein